MASPTELIDRLKQTVRPQAMDASDLASLRGTDRYKEAYDYYLKHATPTELVQSANQDKRVEAARRAAIMAAEAPIPASGAVIPSPEHTLAHDSGPGGYSRVKRLEEVPSDERMSEPLPGTPGSGISEGGQWHPLDTLAYEEAMQTRNQTKARGE